VETHVGSILHKLGVRNRAQAARRYLEANGGSDAA
jgi:DNA-binding NarL/FixJ family response regulator